MHAPDRLDYDVIASWVPQAARVLDLGCGDGELLAHLRTTRGAVGYGVENDPERVLGCVKNGINVLQIDLEQGLYGFRDASFDVVVMSNALQALHRTEKVLREMLRVGAEAILSFPNFAYWKHRQADPGRPHAGVRSPALPVVRHAERALLHHRSISKRCAPSSTCACARAWCSTTKAGRSRRNPTSSAASPSTGSGATAERGRPSAARNHLAGAGQPAHADLRLRRIFLRPAALPAAQPCSGLAQDRGHQPQGRSACSR